MVNLENPLNIRAQKGTKWLGQVGARKGFCTFIQRKYGLRAAAIIIANSYAKRGIRSVRDIISTWAPPSENPTESYISYVTMKTGMGPADIIDTKEKLADLMSAMAFFESRAYIDKHIILAVIESFNICAQRGELS